jgi:DNA-binding GntR family transcriptional regulator
MTAREVREICQVRRALECEAIRLACGRIEVAQLEELRIELRRTISAGPPDGHEIVMEARSIDSRLHDLIAGRSGNAFLVHELGRLKTLFRAFRDAAWDHSESRNDYHRLGAEAHEHLAIIEALLRGDKQGAVRGMARHIASGMKYWCRAIPEPPSRNGRARGVARERVEGEP